MRRPLTRLLRRRLFRIGLAKRCVRIAGLKDLRRREVLLRLLRGKPEPVPTTKAKRDGDLERERERYLGILTP